MSNNKPLTYTQKKIALQQAILAAVQQGQYKPALIRQYGECAYRLDVHDNIEVLKVTAPISNDNQTVMSHWGFVKRTLIALTSERIDNNLQNEQAVAFNNFANVIQSNMNAMVNFDASKAPAETYRNAVLQILQTSYDAFEAFRNTIVKC